jgi:uroporphyrinogen decarboxylase
VNLEIFEMSGISHKERMRTVLSGGLPDRVPVALWRHFPVDDQDPELLANAILAFQKEWDFDFVKVTPASSFCLTDWGVQDVWEGNPEGTRKYTRRAVAQPRDWEKITALDPSKGNLGAQLRVLKLLRTRLEPETPFIQTIFNPLAQAKNLAGDGLLMEHIRRWPDAVQIGLDAITRSTTKFVQACMDAGVDGVFLAIQHASYRLFSYQEYRQWGMPGDQAILHAAQDAWLNVMHLHGEAVMFDLAKEYPVAVVNWHDREAGPSLREGRQRCGKVVCGGWTQWGTIALGDPKMVFEEAKDTVTQMGAKHLILGTGCVTPIITPRACLQAAARAGETDQAA